MQVEVASGSTCVPRQWRAQPLVCGLLRAVAANSWMATWLPWCWTRLLGRRQNWIAAALLQRFLCFWLHTPTCKCK